MDTDEYRAQLTILEEELADVYRRRRALQERYADDHPAQLPKPRHQTDVQARVSRCPRCGGRLENE